MTKECTCGIIDNPFPEYSTTPKKNMIICEWRFLHIWDLSVGVEYEHGMRWEDSEFQIAHTTALCEPLRRLMARLNEPLDSDPGTWRKVQLLGGCAQTDSCIQNGLMWVKQCHKPLIWEWFIPPIYGDLGDGFLLFYPHYWRCKKRESERGESGTQCDIWKWFLHSGFTGVIPDTILTTPQTSEA